MQNRFDPATGTWPNDAAQVPSTSVLSTYTPVAGDLVYCDPSDGKIKPCDSSSGTKANMLGCVLGALPGGTLAAGSGFLFQACGQLVPLSLFLPGASAAAQLASLQALGAISDAYVAPSTAPGKIAAPPGGSLGLYARKAFSIPKRFSDLVAADLTTLFVVLAMGSATAA